MIPEFEKKFGLLPESMIFISSREVSYLYRRLKNEHDNSIMHQIIMDDFTLWSGRWPDVVCRSLDEARSHADELAKSFMLKWEEIEEEIYHDGSSYV